MVRSFWLNFLIDYVIIFMCFALMEANGDSLIKCDEPHYICANDSLYVDCNITENNISNWYFSEIQAHDLPHSNSCTEPKERKEEKLQPFKNLELYAFPVRLYEFPGIYYKAKLCFNLSREDLKLANWLNLEICTDGHRHAVNITDRQKFCEEKTDEPVTLFCYSNSLLATRTEHQVKIKILSDQSSAMFRATFFHWGTVDPSLTAENCKFKQFVYSSETEVNIMMRNCTSRFNVTILKGTEKIFEITNATLNPNLKYKLKENEKSENNDYSDYNVTVLEIVSNENGEYNTSATDISSISTIETTSIKVNQSTESNPPYFLLYLIPIILIIVLTIAGFILHKNMIVVNGSVRTNTPSVKFLYCNCSSHTIYQQQLKSFLLFIKTFCNINIVNSEEQEYKDNESLLQAGTMDPDYVILVPMPEIPTMDSENESHFQQLQQEFIAVKDPKRIILILPFQGDIEIEEFIRSKSEYHGSSTSCKAGLLRKKELHQPAIFYLMDQFIPFIQHVHKKYRRKIFQRGTEFLTRAKINEIKQKLEYYNLTNVGFEFLSNNLNEEQFDENNSLSFINLDNLSL